NRFFNVTETHIFSPRVVNEARFGFLDLDARTINQDIVTAAQLGITRSSNNVTNGIYRFALLGTDIGPNATPNTAQNQHNFTWEDTVSYSMGKHFLRAGGMYTHVGSARNFPQDYNGLMGFNSYQAFLVGAPSYAFDASGVSAHRFLLNDSAAYFQ